METMTVKHPRWDEFCGELEGKKGCNFRQEKGKTTWDCKGGDNKDFAKAILGEFGEVDLEKSLKYFDSKGGYCDCEILFNVNRRAVKEMNSLNKR